MKTHQTCPDCGHNECLTVYDDGGSKCHSCGKWKPGVTVETPEEVSAWDEPPTTEVFKSYRGHSRAALEILKVPVLLDTLCRDYGVDYKYPDGVTKRRVFPKTFRYLTGPKAKPDLFLSDRFSSGSAMAITITEGEEDAHAAFEMLGSKYPVVSVRSSSSAVPECTAKKEYLDGFEKIYLDFDEDEPGRRARDQA